MRTQPLGVPRRRGLSRQDQNDKLAATRAAKTREQLEELRHSQEMGERMDRQRAAMSSAFP